MQERDGKNRREWQGTLYLCMTAEAAANCGGKERPRQKGLWPERTVITGCTVMEEGDCGRKEQLQQEGL